MNLWQQLERVAAATPAEGRHRAVLFHGARVALALGLAIVTYLLFPSSPAVQVPLYEIGAVAADNVIAPFAFEVDKAPDELAREQEQMARSAEPVFVFVPAAMDSARAQLDAFMRALDQATAGAGARTPLGVVQRAAEPYGLHLTPAEASYLVVAGRREAIATSLARAFDRWLAAGVTTGSALDQIRGDVVVRRGGEERTVPSESITTFPVFLARAMMLQPDPGSPAGATVYRRLATAFFHPTLVLDRAATERAREDLRRAVPLAKYSVRAGEKIVGAHEVVGREEYEKLRALQHELQGRGGQMAVGRIIGAVLFNFLLIGILGFTFILYRAKVYASMRSLALVAAGFLLVLIGAAAVAHWRPDRPELVPIAVAAVLFSTLFDSRLSLLACLILAVLVGSQAPLRGTNALFLALVGGTAAAMSVRIIRRRNQFVSSILTVAAAYVAASVVLGLSLGWTGSQIAASAGTGAANALLTVPLAMVLLPLAEELTGIDTYFKLLEWSDLNRPLMQRLSLEAPGTYNHTVFLANLAEGAANAIGANGLLARVGAYYHDIGKLKKPQYFVENQPKGRNPHDKLKPSTSAAIIRNHVREGLELAEEYKLPKAIRAFITEHHGTGQIAYFMEKARERDGEVNPNEFMYPGPLPRTPETAIVMLADGVEASTRVIQDPTPQKIRDVVAHIVKQRIDQGQLREAPLTLAQIEVIKEQFARILIGQFHNRIDYPAAGGGVTSEFASV